MNSSALIENSSDGVSYLHFQCLKASAMYPVDERFHINYKLLIAFDVFLAPWAFVLNLLVLIVLIRHRSLRTVPNCILMSLAVSDMIAGFLIQPMKAVITTMILHRKINCILYLTALQLGYLMGMTSYLSLTLMSVERYVAIFYPFKYHQWTSKKTVVLKPILAVWLFSTVIMGLSFLTPQMSVMRLFVIILIPTSILWSAFVYIKVTMLVRKLNSQVASVCCNDSGHQQTAVGQEKTEAHTSHITDQTDKETNQLGPSIINSMKKEETQSFAKKLKKYNQKLKPNSKATRLVIIIMAILCLCYIPSGVLTFLRDYSNLKEPWIRGVHDWGTSFVLLNSTLNPIIYCLKITEMRVKIKIMLCNIIRKVTWK
ncbi:probable G-protein coupled receptor No18 [Rhopilema esculentum]|uniref:probable G-protein coupled receptor No18 n=1 Tax=Rhopilema esculentum TaxID=499914 RepID=UPI0031D417CF|eukprot:gene9412-17125_t